MTTLPQLKAKAKENAHQRLSLVGQLRQARISLERFINPKILDKQLKEDTFIPKRVLQKAKGLVFLTVIQGGFLVAANGGTGCVIVRKAQGGWTGPSSIAVAGLSFGALAGASKIDYILILPNENAVKQFSGRKQIRLGSEIQIALGPLGRDVSASAGAGDKGEPSVIYSYSHAKGLYGGTALSGKYITVRDDCNQDYYKSPIKCDEILEGEIEAPSNDDYNRIIKLLDDYCREERILSHDVNINNPGRSGKETVVMSGYLEKESRHLKKWRKRWVILSSYGILYTFKTKENLNTNSATEALRLEDFLPPRTFDIDVFSLTYKSNKKARAWISFKAGTKEIRDKWIDQIHIFYTQYKKHGFENNQNVSKEVSEIIEQNKQIPQIKESGLDSVIKCLENINNIENKEMENDTVIEDRKVLIDSVKWQQKLYKNNKNAIKDVKAIETNLEKESSVVKQKHENFIDINEAAKCTKEILSNVNGDLSNKNTLFQLISAASPGTIFYDPNKKTNLNDNNGDEKQQENSKEPIIVLKLSTVPGLDFNDTDNKQDTIRAQKQLISEMKYALNKKDTDHPILRKTRQSLADVYGVSIENVIITNVYYGSCCFAHKMSQSEKHKNILTDPNIDKKLKDKFRYFENYKVHPLMFDAFNVNDFDLRGNKDFSSENSTYQIGPPDRKKPYTQPHGWTRYGLNVLGQYKDGKGDAWLHPFNTDKSWYRAYHGIGNGSGDRMKVAQCIKEKGFLPGGGQACRGGKDIYGRTIKKGVYCTPDLTFASGSYGSRISLKMNDGTTKQFNLVFQVCVDPDEVQIDASNEKYWIAPNEEGLIQYGKIIKPVYKTNIRPYGILLKEV